MEKNIPEKFVATIGAILDKRTTSSLNACNKCTHQIWAGLSESYSI